MNELDKYADKHINLSELCELIKPGDRIFLSSGPATPVHTLTSLLKTKHPNLLDLEFIQIASLGSPFPDPKDSVFNYRRKSFIVGENISLAFNSGNIDFLPTNLAELPYLFVSGAVGVDIAIIQTSVPDAKGDVSLGVVNDISKLVLEKVPLVIAEINPNVPATNGETSIPIRRFNHILKSEEQLIELKLQPHSLEMERLAWHVANLVPNGATLSMGASRITAAIAQALKHKTDLRVYTFIISDWVKDLIESGTISKKKLIERNAPVVCAAAVGSSEFYRYTNNNPHINLLPILQSSYQTSLPRIKKLTSIINVSRIDLSGDSVVIPSQEYQVGGFDGKLSFSVASTHSRGGKSIIVLPSVDLDNKSNIVISHNHNSEVVRSTLGSTKYVVTEYGVASIFGLSIRERALALIDIAHPSHQEQLIKDAKKVGLLHEDQVFNVLGSANYPHELETVASFGKRLQVVFRPIKQSDEDMMRRLFYKFSSKSRFQRYFSPIRSMPHNTMQHYVSVDHDTTLSLVGLVQDAGFERIIAECRYSYDKKDNNYELAFAVDEEFQKTGIGRFMLHHLLEIAQKRNIEKLVAYVLPKNKNMISLCKRSEYSPKEIDGDDTSGLEFHFFLGKEADTFRDIR